jgi:glycosyltransferase involved in cell wall biosynthesis
LALSLSICIPTFNRAALLRETLLHLEQLHHCFDEVVVSDNASPDATPDVVAELAPRFRKLVYFRHPTNRGMTRNYHACLALGTCDLLFQLSDDDALLPDGFTAAVAELEADPACVAVYGGYERSLDNLASVAYTALPPRPGRFTGADIGLIAQSGNLLTLPIVRREVFQRHCFYDDTSFGTLRLIAQLSRHGAIRVLDYPIYRHRDSSPNSAEVQLCDPWYLDFNRSDWELFVGMLSRGDFDFTAQLVAGGAVPLYRMAIDLERQRNRPLHERSFLIRYLAYVEGREGEAVAEKVAEWERTRLIAATMERLAEAVGFCSALKRVVIEQTRLNIAGIWDGIAERFPRVAALQLDSEAFVAHVQDPGDFLLADNWASLQRRADAGGIDRVAVTDLIASLRVPGSKRVPLLFGPSGAPHFSTDR